MQTNCAEGPAAPLLPNLLDNLHVQSTVALAWGQLSFPCLVQTYHDAYPRGSLAQLGCI